MRSGYGRLNKAEEAAHRLPIPDTTTADNDDDDTEARKARLLGEKVGKALAHCVGRRAVTAAVPLMFSSQRAARASHYGVRLFRDTSAGE